MVAQSDPRDPSLEVPLSLPKSWKQDYGTFHLDTRHYHQKQKLIVYFSSEGMAALSMFLSGSVMVSRNRQVFTHSWAHMNHRF
jgi:hypothetical protein